MASVDDIKTCEPQGKPTNPLQKLKAANTTIKMVATAECLPDQFRKQGPITLCLDKAFDPDRMNICT